jgi:predicted DNA-binding protein with PD1-like motif
MKTALLHEIDGLRTIAVVLEHGDEAMAAMASFALEHRLGGSHFTAAGAFSRAVVAYFEWPARRYRHISARADRSGGPMMAGMFPRRRKS